MTSNVFNQGEPNTGPMTLEYASNLLGMCTRYELRDHAFGDREVSWLRGDVEVADGYFGGGTAEVHIHIDFSGGGSFTGEDAYKLVERGSEVRMERNDETGPDEYRGA